MAPQEDQQQVEENKKSFDQEQLAALETISGERPEDVIKAAERIGILSDETRAKIEAEFPGHILQFQAALSKEKREGAPDKEAFVRAFKNVYGKFVLEQTDPELQTPEGPFMKAMKRVLKPKSHAKMGESPAIKAAAARLSALTSEKARMDAERRISEKQVKKSNEEAKLPNLEQNDEFYSDLLDVFNNNIDVTEKIHTKLDALKKSKTLAADIDSIKTLLEEASVHIDAALTDDSVEQEFSGIKASSHEIINAINDFNSKPSRDLFIDDVKEIVNKFEEFISNFRSKFKSAKSSSSEKLSIARKRIEKLDREILDLKAFGGTKFEESLEPELAPLRAKSKETNKRQKEAKNRYNTYQNGKEQSIKSFDEQMKDVQELEERKADLQNAKQYLESGELERIASNFPAFQRKYRDDLVNATNESEIIAVFTDLVDFRNELSKLFNNESLPDSLRVLINNYLQKHEVLKAEINIPGIDISNTIERFLNNTFDPFINDFSSDLPATLTKAKDDIDLDLSNIDIEIKRRNDDVDQMSAVVTDFGNNADKAKKDLDIADKKAKKADQELTTLPYDKLLKKAFPVVNPVEKRKAYRAQKRAAQTVRDADKAQDYLEESGTKDSITSAYSTFASYKSDLDLNSRFNAATRSDLSRSNLKTSIRELMRGNRDEKKLGDDLKVIQKRAIALQKSMRDFVQYLPVLMEVGVVTKPANANKTSEQLVQEYRHNLNVNGPETTLEDLDTFAQELLKYFNTMDFDKIDQQFANGIPKLQEKADEAKAKFDELDKADKKQHLTETQASKQIIMAILKEQYPDMKDEELKHLATLILTDDIETIQTLDSYEELAKKAMLSFIKLLSRLDSRIK